MCRCVGIERRGASAAPQTGVQQRDLALCAVQQRDLALCAVQQRDLALCAVQLRADIGDILAEVTVTQTFRNAHSAALEVTFEFPLHASATVYALTATTTDGKVVQCKVRERQEAAAVYEAAKNSGHQAFLLEESKASADMFAAKLGRVEPACEVRIELKYATPLAYEGRNLRLLVPSAIAARFPNMPPQQQHATRIPRPSPRSQSRVRTGQREKSRRVQRRPVPGAAAVAVGAGAAGTRTPFSLHITARLAVRIARMWSPSHGHLAGAVVGGADTQLGTATLLVPDVGVGLGHDLVVLVQPFVDATPGTVPRTSVPPAAVLETLQPQSAATASALIRAVIRDDPAVSRAVGGKHADAGSRSGGGHATSAAKDPDMHHALPLGGGCSASSELPPAEAGAARCRSDAYGPSPNTPLLPPTVDGKSVVRSAATGTADYHRAAPHEESKALLVSVSLDDVLPPLEDVHNTLARGGQGVEYTFLVDRSNSMSKDDRIGCVRQALQVCLASLPAHGTRFNIVGFGTTQRSLFLSPRTYDDTSRAAAMEHIAGLQANLGGTHINQPLQDVLEAPLDHGWQRKVLLLTDGQVKHTRSVVDTVTRARAAAPPGAVSVFAFGIGSTVSTALCDGVALAGGGTAEYVAAGEEVRPKMVRQLARAMQPGIAAVEVNWGGLPLVADSVVTQAGSRILAAAIVPPTPGVEWPAVANVTITATSTAGVHSHRLLLAIAQPQRPPRSGVYRPAPAVEVDTADAAAARVAVMHTTRRVAHVMYAHTRIKQLEAQHAQLSGGDGVGAMAGTRADKMRADTMRRQAVALAVRYNVSCVWASFVGVQEGRRGAGAPTDSARITMHAPPAPRVPQPADDGIRLVRRCGARRPAAGAAGGERARRASRKSPRYSSCSTAAPQRQAQQSGSGLVGGKYKPCKKIGSGAFRSGFPATGPDGEMVWVKVVRVTEERLSRSSSHRGNAHAAAAIDDDSRGGDAGRRTSRSRRRDRARRTPRRDGDRHGDRGVDRGVSGAGSGGYDTAGVAAGDLLAQFAVTQATTGYWQLTPSLAALLSLRFDTLAAKLIALGDPRTATADATMTAAAAPPQLSTSAWRVWGTALVMAALAVLFPTRRDEWMLLASKARAWLAAECAAAGAMGSAAGAGGPKHEEVQAVAAATSERVLRHAEALLRHDAEAAVTHSRS